MAENNFIEKRKYRSNTVGEKRRLKIARIRKLKKQKSIEKYIKAKKNKDFKAADAIRDKLAAYQLTVKDTPDGNEVRHMEKGTVWFVAH